MEKTEKTVTITVKEYEELQCDADFLSCLMAAGVDSWDGWDAACEMMDEDK